MSLMGQSLPPRDVRTTSAIQPIAAAEAPMDPLRAEANLAANAKVQRRHHAFSHRRRHELVHVRDAFVR
jgi:hypothetical protein